MATKLPSAADHWLQWPQLVDRPRPDLGGERTESLWNLFQLFTKTLALLEANALISCGSTH
ncbi:hypothetical protein AOLI_G00220150 [Acnodon oligacanthus]